MSISNRLDDPAVRAFVVNSRDVTDQRALIDQLAHQAFHDDLTNLPNRALLRDRVTEAIDRARESAAAVSILVVGLDGFTLVNDSLGHHTADTIPKEMARRLERCVRDGDVAARLAGAEFAVLVQASEREATVADRILEELRRPVVVDGKEVFVHGSVGVADTTNESIDADELIRRTGIAMVEAKKDGGNRSTPFECRMQAALVARQAMATDLRHALTCDEITLFYQPIVALPSCRVEGFEALMRWHHPRHEMVGPAEFIPLAEKTGLIIDLGRFAIREACRQLAQWREHCPGGEEMSMSVNVSMKQPFDADLVSVVRTAIRESGIPPERLTLELTESTLLADTDFTLSRLER